MVKIQDKALWINDKKEFIVCGEIHYYRLEKSEWQDRINKLKDAGCNAVASYIPWICHEEEEGVFDLTGWERENLDVIGFIELCAANDLYFVARPGPFVMAEMKNEGIPYWVEEKYPKLRSYTWEHRITPNKTLDYLAPDFLHCVEKWYEQIMPVIAEHLITNGGNIIACQLDNEIGMLSWVANAPDLSDVVLCDFEEWLKKRYSEDELKLRYPFWTADFENRRSAYERPEDSYGLKFHKDLGYYMRDRYARYALELKKMAEKYGVKDIPFLINIHGTGGGRGHTFPVGISQLVDAYTQSPDFYAGSDIYLSGITMENLQDIYIIHCYMEAVNLPSHPLGCFEFQSGEADYGEMGAGRLDVSDADFTARICALQGNVMLNHYLFCGGRNYILKKPRPDGNHRIAITGERHGFSAPVNPEGKLSYMFPRMKRANTILKVNGEKLSGMREVRADLAIGFIPDYFMTEYSYTPSEREMVGNVTRWRTGTGWDCFTKALLLNQFHFGGVNLQGEIPLISQTGMLYVLSASYMDAKVQTRLKEFVETGGTLLLYGRLPQWDMEGNVCRIFADFLEVSSISFKTEQDIPVMSIQPVGVLGEYAEVRTYSAEVYEGQRLLPLMELSVEGGICAFEKQISSGKVVMIGTDYICHVPAIRKLMQHLGRESALAHDCEYNGILMAMSAAMDTEERFLHVMNIDAFAKTTKLYENGEVLFEGKEMYLGSRDGYLLPLHLQLEDKEIVYATAEIYDYQKNRVQFRLTQPQDVIVWKGEVSIQPSEAYDVKMKCGNTYVYSKRDGRIEEFLTILF